MQLIECVPNFSEGNDQSVIDQLVATIESTPDVQLLDQTKDSDHNRCVLTFIGPPAAVTQAAFAATKQAAALINLTSHQGVHPRLGATDVIPLIPLKGITDKELLPYANDLAQRITTELQIPTHLYEKSAQSPEKQDLSFIRNKKPQPDFTPTTPHPTAGQTVVGVRDILIAFNVNLESTDLTAAKTIAAKVRHSSGGLPSLKALGLRLSDCVQVSMNLTDYRQTSPLQAYQAVAQEAQKLGIQIRESELIGLIPQEALPENPETTIKLPHYKILPL